MMRLDKRPWWRLSPMVWTLLLAWGVMVSVWFWFMQEGLLTDMAQAHRPTPQVSSPMASPTAWPMAVPVAPAPSAPSRALHALPAEQLASDLAAQYRQPDESLLARHQGRPFRVLGRVVDQQVSEASVVVVHMDAGEGLPPLRLVMAAGSGASGAPLANQVAALACIHGGIVMGEPLLRDCRLIRIDNP
jgi:hypothetical protein